MRAVARAAAKAEEARAEAKRKLRRVFNLIDTGGEGGIKKREIMRALSRDAGVRDALLEASPRLAPLTKPRTMAKLFRARDAGAGGGADGKVGA